MNKDQFKTCFSVIRYAFENDEPLTLAQRQVLTGLIAECEEAEIYELQKALAYERGECDE